MPETIFWWVFTPACVFAFFFSYGMVEDLIRKCIRAEGDRKVRQSPTEPLPLGSTNPSGDGHDRSLLH